MFLASGSAGAVNDILLFTEGVCIQLMAKTLGSIKKAIILKTALVNVSLNFSGKNSNKDSVILRLNNVI